MLEEYDSCVAVSVYNIPLLLQLKNLEERVKDTDSIEHRGRTERGLGKEIKRGDRGGGWRGRGGRNSGGKSQTDAKQTIIYNYTYYQLYLYYN